MQLKNSFIMIIFFLAANVLAAQEAYIIYEGTQLNYKVEFHEGNTYAWETVNGSNNVEFDFLTDPNFSEVGIQWNQTGLYYLIVNETDAGGCSNKKALAVQVQPNNRSIGFDVVASTECFNITGNSFNVQVNVSDNNSQPLSAGYFPLTVEFTVNGSIQSQLLEFNNQVLQIPETMFAANPAQNTSVELVITGVTDVKNAPVQAGTLNGTHIRTIFAIPEIEFTEALRRKYNIINYEEITAFTDSDSRRLERLEPE